jgi:hypothetical protein
MTIMFGHRCGRPGTCAVRGGRLPAAPRGSGERHGGDADWDGRDPRRGHPSHRNRGIAPRSPPPGRPARESHHHCLDVRRSRHRWHQEGATRHAPGRPASGPPGATSGKPPARGAAAAGAWPRRQDPGTESDRTGRTAGRRDHVQIRTHWGRQPGSGGRRAESWTSTGRCGGRGARCGC